MVRYISLFLILFSFTNCSSININRQQVYSSDSSNENSLLLLAMDYRIHGNFQESSKLFKKLYTSTHKKGYLVEYFKTLNEGGFFSKVIEESKNFQIDSDEERREVGKSYFLLQDFPNALKMYSEISNPIDMDFRFLAEIYFQLKDYKKAFENIQKAYQIDPAPELVLSMAKIEYIYFGNIQKAISLLNSHNKLYQFSDEVAQYLAKIYRDIGKNVEALEIYRELYKKRQKEEYAIAIIELLSYLSKTDELIEFLEKSQVSSELLLRLYMSNREYEKGYRLSQKLLESDTKNPYLLAQNAIFEYKVNIAKKEKLEKFLPDVIEKLEKSVYQLQDASYFNYLGYIMIDHDYRIRDGMKYIKMALEIEPDSYYIIDSLAWGEYKLKNCDVAYEIMKKVVENLGLEDSEIREHWEKIRKCNGD
ncbi:MAG TPA: hypothetical protein EYO61_03065 [Campylobacterales bacterium]|nr:hypothetical protein [Campylobacterales bacterium]